MKKTLPVHTAPFSNEYSLVPNRRGAGISGGGLEKSSKHNKRVGWNSRGVGNDATIKPRFLFGFY